MLLYPGKQIRRRDLAYATIAAALALAYALDLRPQAASTPENASVPPAERLRLAERIAAHHAGTLAGCLGDGMIVWVDPHTGARMGTFCETEVLSSGGRK